MSLLETQWRRPGCGDYVTPRHRARRGFAHYASVHARSWLARSLMLTGVFVLAGNTLFLPDPIPGFDLPANRAELLPVSLILSLMSMCAHDGSNCEIGYLGGRQFDFRGKENDPRLGRPPHRATATQSGRDPGLLSWVKAIGEGADLGLSAQALAQVATPLATPSDLLCPNDENLIPNAGFEAGMEGWYIEGAVNSTTSDVNDGSMAMRLGSPEASGYLDRSIPAIAPGATYVLSGSGKLSSDGEPGEIGMLFRDSNGDRLADDEPPPLTFSSTEFIQQRVTFTAPPRVAQAFVYVSKDDGTAEFFVDSLSLTVCDRAATPASTPAATPARATPAVGVPPTPIGTPQLASPPASIGGPSQDATPPIARSGTLTEFDDPDAGFSVGYPADWRRLTRDEIRALLGVGDDRAAEAALANTRLIVVSPDGKAIVAITRLPRRPESAPLDDVVQSVQEVNAASISDVGEIAAEPFSLDGRDAVRLSFSAAGPVTEAADERLIRQVIATTDDSTLVLTAILEADSVARFEETLRQIEESWRWHPDRGREEQHDASEQR